MLASAANRARDVWIARRALPVQGEHPHVCCCPASCRDDSVLQPHLVPLVHVSGALLRDVTLR
jgi:hypothetical protein